MSKWVKHLERYLDERVLTLLVVTIIVPKLENDSNPSLLSLLAEDAPAFRAAISAFVQGKDYRARQIERRVFSGSASFDNWTELPEDLRRTLAASFTLRTTHIDKIVEDDDAKKLRLCLSDGLFVEAVLISDGGGRKTACLSTQAGCAMGCVFCQTGKIGFKRNLSAAEIIEQYFFLAEYGAISNIVIMGMGEPLLNMKALAKALSFILDGGKTSGRESSARRRVTVSTSGIIEGLRSMPAVLPGVRLAVSITTARDDLRRALMPHSVPLPLLKDALLDYQRQEKKRITLEAVLLGGINTTREDAECLAQFASGLSVMVNLIPWNAVDGVMFDGQPLRRPDKDEVRRFAAMLEERGLNTEVRRSKGGAGGGACGTLGA